MRRAAITPRGAEQNPQPTLASEDVGRQVPGNAWTAFIFQTKQINTMGSMKNYLLTLLEQCSEGKFGQDAVEAAIVNGALPLTYNLTTDLHTIFDLRSNCCDAPPQGECCANGSGRCRQCGKGAQFESNYDRFVVAYQKQCREHGDALVEIYHASGLMEEILRPIPLAQHEYAHTHTT